MKKDTRTRLFAINTASPAGVFHNRIVLQYEEPYVIVVDIIALINIFIR